ncbi:MAG: peptide chain release factor aRF-1 [Candidatus Aenigmarchaeota archaeon]|nr:peptide chain release factor aRF-1 [Candidatus Aenigmarchaeota archaeon]
MGEIALKKLIRQLGAIKGRHTELVTVYVPAGYSLHEVSGQLRSEQGTAENIKSKGVRKNVVSSLEKIIRHLQLYNKTPPNGLALFCGNVSEKEGVDDIELFAVEPPEMVKTRLYWCDQKFVLEPLEEMVKEKEVYGIVCLDKSEADIAILSGKKIKPMVHFDSIVPGKTRAGGQSSARFARVREGLLEDWLKKVGEAANKLFGEHKEIVGIIVSGSGPVKDMFLKGDYMYGNLKQKVIGAVDTSYTGEFGLHETLERGEDLLKESAVVKEKKLLQRFLEELHKAHGLVVYGAAEVIGALEMGAVDTVIVSEGLDMKEVEYECSQHGLQKKFVFPDKKSQKCGQCQQVMRILGERDIAEAFEERVKNYGTKLALVSTDTREGQQFLYLGGVGALLRYGI